MSLLSRAVVPMSLVASTAVLWAVRPGVVENGVRSPVAWAVGVGTLLAGLGVREVARRMGAAPPLAQVLGVGVVVALVVAVLAPSFQQRTLVEDLPDELAGVAMSDPVPTSAPTAAAPTAAPGSVPRAAATVDRSGELRGIGHSARGTVRLRTTAAAAYLVFDDIDVEGTVGPSVHLVEPGRRTPSGGIRVGDLKAERGTFTYRLPAGTDLTKTSVLVWCDPYDTPIALADTR